MKYLIAIALAMCVVACAANEVCHDVVENSCNTDKEPTCKSAYGIFLHDDGVAQGYIEMQLTKSYQYLLLSTYYNSYIKNRPGFQKLYQSLSDRSFESTIDLIKQVTRRGGSVNFINNADVRATKYERKLEVNELHSLALALDNEKDLASEAFHVHYYSTHGHKPSEAKEHQKHSHKADPEMAHYIEENFLASQAKSIRKLSGYVNDLGKMMKTSDPSLAVYLFDEYLQKQ